MVFGLFCVTCLLFLWVLVVLGDGYCGLCLIVLLLDVIFTWFLLLCVDFVAWFGSWCFLLVYCCAACGVVGIGIGAGLIAGFWLWWLILFCVTGWMDWCLALGFVFWLCVCFLVDFVWCFFVCWRMILLYVGG